jgi:nitroreductase
MDVIEAIRKRRSIRSYKAEPIPGEVLDRLLEAIRLAPSGGNRQPYRFIVVRDAEMKARIAAACRWHPGRPKGQDFITEAPIVIVACGSEGEAISRFYRDGDVYLAMGRDVPAGIDRGPASHHNLMDMDIAIALDHLTLAAAAEGLGTCWVAALDEREMKSLLSVPEDMRVLAVMPLGYTDSWPAPRPRKPLNEIICYEKYS